jgi:hypothetical protein
VVRVQIDGVVGRQDLRDIVGLHLVVILPRLSLERMPGRKCTHRCPRRDPSHHNSSTRDVEFIRFQRTARSFRTKCSGTNRNLVRSQLTEVSIDVHKEPGRGTLQMG